jgi:phosphoglycerate dehydrogenase-like enzyme
MSALVLASFPERKGDRELFDRVLGKSARVVFWPAVPEKEKERVLSETEVLVSWNPRWDFRSEMERVFRGLSRLRLLQLVTAGADHAPFAFLGSQVAVACNPGAYAEPVAEHALALLLALAKRIPVEHAKLKEGVFDDATPNRLLRGARALVVGFGGIGKAIGRLLRAFGVSLTAINRTGRTEEPVLACGTLAQLLDFLPGVDIVILSLPLVRSTRGLIGQRELEAMREDAILINVARGELIDEALLYERLVRCPHFLVGLDTWWREPRLHGSFELRFPILTLPNVLGSPHNATSVPGIRAAALKLALENVRAFLQTQEIPRGRVHPEDYWP